MIGVPDEKWGETIKALVVQTEGSEVTEQELIDHCKSKVARYKAPVVDRVPRGAGPHRHRQAAEVQAARALLGGPRAPGQLTPPAPVASAHADSGWDSPRCWTCWYPPAARRRLGRGGPGLRGPRRPTCGGSCWPSTRWPPSSPRRSSRGPQLLVTPPPAAAQGVHGGRGDRPQGAVVHRLVAGRLRAAHRAHQRRLTRRRGLGVARPGARAGRGTRRWSPTRPRRWTSSSCSPPSRPPSAMRAAPGGRRRGPHRRLRRRHVHLRGEGRFRPSRGRGPRSVRWAGPSWSTRCASRWCCPRPRRAAVLAAMRAAHPYEEPGVRRRSSWPPLDGPGPRAPAGSGRLPAPLTPARVRGARGRRCSPRPRTASAWPGTPTGSSRAWGCAAARATSCSTASAASGVDVYLTSDLRHHPAGASSSSTAVPRARRRGALGGRVDLAAGAPAPAGATARGDTVERPRQHDAHRPVDVPGLRPRPTPRPQGAPAEGRPVAQLRLLDVQELDSRLDQLRHQLAVDPRAGPARRARRPAYGATSTDKVRDLRIAGRRPDPRAEARRRRRRAGQGPPGARPGHDRRRPGAGPQGAGADARRAGVAAAPDHRARGHRARGDGAARDGPDLARPEIGRAGRAGRRGRPSCGRPATRRPATCRPELAEDSAERGARPSRGMPEDLLALYEKLRAQKDGVGAAALRRRECGGCRLTLNASDLAVIARAPSRRGGALRGVQPDPGAHRGVRAVSGGQHRAVVIEADGGSRGNPGPVGLRRRSSRTPRPAR